MALTQGIYTPKNPEKYKGDATKIIYRSSWELTVLRRFDLDPNVLQYSSEEIVIPYISPLDNRRHRYFVDFWVRYLNKDGEPEERLLEIKPSKEMAPPEPPRSGVKPNKSYIRQVHTYVVNKAKWEAAEKYCAMKGWKFQLLNEYHIGIKK